MVCCRPWRWCSISWTGPCFWVIAIRGVDGGGPGDVAGYRVAAGVSIALYYHTLKYLRPVQIYGRAVFRCLRPQPDLTTAPTCRAVTGRWVAAARRRPSLM